MKMTTAVFLILGLFVGHFSLGNEFNCAMASTEQMQQIQFSSVEEMKSAVDKCIEQSNALRSLADSETNPAKKYSLNMDAAAASARGLNISSRLLALILK